MTPKPQETFYDSHLETAYLKINGYLTATLKKGIFEVFEDVSKEDEDYYLSLLEDETKSHNYHAKNMSTNYN